MIDYSTGPDLLEAVERFDLIAFVKDHGATKIQNKKNEWALFCTSCGKEKLIVNTDKKTWHCWVCQEFVTVVTPSGPKRKAMGGAGGLIDLIQKFDEIDRKAAIARILSGGLLTASDLAQIPMTELVQNVEAAGNMDPILIDYPENWALMSDHARAYCWRRGIHPESIVNFGLFWCPTGRYANRLIFPVYERADFVYFQARAMWEPKPGDRFIKSLNPSRTENAAVSSEVLMNLDVASNYERVCLTEGPVDCIHAGYDAVCTFGKSLHTVQIAKLLRAGVKKIDIMWDADAFKEACVTGLALTSLFDVRIVQLPYGDPGDFHWAELNWYRQRAQPISGIATI